MRKDKIYVAGHNGMVGSAIVRFFKRKKNVNLLLRDKKDLDLTNQNLVKNFFKKEKPDQVYLAAARVGGIYYNENYPADSIYENLTIQINVINAAFLSGVKKLLFLGSSCIYPKQTTQPIKEEKLLTGKLEPTNEPYAIAKIAGIKICESYNRQYGKSHDIDYRSIMPTNLYGPGDNYHLQNCHVIPALIRKFHEAKIKNKPYVEVWGTGTPRREFLYVDDFAGACHYLMNIDKIKYYKKTRPMCSHVNVGSGSDLTIKDLARIISKIVKYNGSIQFDKSKPDGIKKKLIDSSLMKNFGWQSKYKLDYGLRRTYGDYLLRVNKEL